MPRDIPFIAHRCDLIQQCPHPLCIIFVFLLYLYCIHAEPRRSRASQGFPDVSKMNVSLNYDTWGIYMFFSCSNVVIGTKLFGFRV
jgi:hypothetical protein